MDSETLERLMLDRALGALSSDCAALLAEYLERHPEAAVHAGELEATAALARKALEQPLPANVPAFLARPQKNAGVAPRRDLFTSRSPLAGYLRWVSGIAAAVLVGFGAHAFLYYTPAAGTGTSAGGRVLVAAVPQTVSEDHPNQEGFWSARRLYERAAQGRSSRPEGVIWDSPVKMPRVGDQT